MIGGAFQINMRCGGNKSDGSMNRRTYDTAESGKIMTNQNNEVPRQAQNPDQSGEDCYEGDGQVRNGVITFLSKQHKLDMLTEEGVAAGLGVTPRTIRRMTERCEIPKPLLLGGRRFWQVGTLVEYLHAKSRLTLKEAQIEAERTKEISEE